MSDLIKRDEVKDKVDIMLALFQVSKDLREEAIELFIDNIPTVELKVETKFYYIESIDDYWIGEDLGDDCTLYYAKWNGKLGFVWNASRYLPWGEHVVSPTSLWKEYTYPSEPKEIPFTDWIIGFLNKYFTEEEEENESN